MVSYFKESTSDLCISHLVAVLVCPAADDLVHGLLLDGPARLADPQHEGLLRVGAVRVEAAPEVAISTVEGLAVLVHPPDSAEDARRRHGLLQEERHERLRHRHVRTLQESEGGFGVDMKVKI